jgi:rhodanese-related sulfurtransferase
MPRTFNQMVAEAEAEVPAISPAEAKHRQERDPRTLIIDVRDLLDRRASGMIAGSIPISSGTLPFKADHEVPESWRDPRVQDRSIPVITACDLGPMSAIAAKTLKDLGFTDVAYIEGGFEAWKEAGLPTEPATDS